MCRRGTRERARRWACGVEPGRVAILWGQDANGTAGVCTGGGAGPAREAGTGRTQGGRAHTCVSRGGWVGRLAHQLV
jgi:hypothetical protein